MNYMKKLIALVISLVAVIGLSGCGSSVDNYNDNLTTLFLVDDQGFSYGGIPYRCDSMRDWSVTAPNGEFSFYPPDNCEFDFLNYNGDNGHGFIDDDIVRIVDIDHRGKGNIFYDCQSFGASTTFGNGSFFYDIDDQCKFYL